MVLIIRIRKLYFDSACIQSFLPNIKTETSILKQEISMQHKNIHIIKHAKQIKTNTAYRCRPGPRWQCLAVATGIYMQHDIIKQKIKHVWIKN